MQNDTPLWFSIIVFSLLLLGLTAGGAVVLANTASVDTTVKISICGNNIQEGGEQCDGSDLNNQTCQKQGYEAGSSTLSCNFACDFDYSGCGEPVEEEEEGSSYGGSIYTGGSSDEDRQTNKVSKKEVEKIDEKYTAVRVRGFTAPNNQVFLLQAGVRVASSSSSNKGAFSLQTDELSAGTHHFSVYAIDSQGKKTKPRTFSLEVEPEVITTLSEIILPPTTSISKSPQADELILQGYTIPSSTVALFRDDNQITSNLVANESGMYLYNIDVADLPVGEHTFQSQASHQDKNSLTSTPVLATLETDQLQLENRLWSPADVNKDGAVDMIDFSTLIYWHGKDSPPDDVDLDKDGQITMRDLSILAYHWTG